MTKFRFGVSDLAVHFYRYRNYVERDLVCPMYKEDKEDEVHFVLRCSFLEDMRNEFITPKYFRTPSTFRFGLLMASQNE